MGHKTKVNGTTYEVSGGRTKVNGTGYGIDKGRTLVGGTGYSVDFKLPPALLKLWNYGTINGIAYGNGYWVAVGNYSNGYDTRGRLAYATSLDGTWTIKDLWTCENSSGCDINCITYANGYFVIGGKYTKCTYNNPYQPHYVKLAYTTNPSGSWSEIDMWSVSYGSGRASGHWIRDITYANGYWVFCGQFEGGNYYGAKIGYATSPSDSWTQKNLWTDINNVSFTGAQCITYSNGYWVVGGGHGYNACVAYATTPNGTWTVKNNVGAGQINDINYGNGYWVGAYYYNSGRHGGVFYSTSLNSSTWTQVQLNPSTINGIEYVNGVWAAVGGTSAPIYYTTNPAGEWSKINAWGSTNGNETLYNITYENGYWLVGGRIDDKQTGVLAYAGSIDQLANAK